LKVQETRPRSDETKERITQAARKLFSEMGYERTTIRAVASAANIDPSKVMRYFGSKDGLFADVSSFDLRLPDLSKLPRAEVGERLARHVLARWQGSDGEDLVILIRAAASNEEARTRMREVFRAQVLPAVAGITKDEGEAALKAELIGSQVLGLAFCRFVLDLPILGGEDREPIAKHIGAVIQMHLFGEEKGR
jgi:AcrR family transcriptional regulator